MNRIDPDDPMVHEVDALPDRALVETFPPQGPGSVWYAALAKPREGGGRRFSADFAKGGDTEEEAIQRCVTAIRADLRKGENSHFTGLDLHYLLDHWKARS